MPTLVGGFRWFPTEYLVELTFCLGSISCQASWSSLRVGQDFSVLSSFTLSAYLNVLRVCSEQLNPGETFAIMTVLQFPVNDPLRTWVSFEPRKGVCYFSKSIALIHSLRAKRDLLISAPSIQVYLSVSIVSAPLSEPARSIKLIIPNTLPSSCFSVIVSIACDQEESTFAPVTPVVLSLSPNSRTFNNSSSLYTFFSVKPWIQTLCLLSSLQCNPSQLFKRSNNFEQ